jgi:MSHA biogenesis protein MshQ
MERTACNLRRMMPWLRSLALVVSLLAAAPVHALRIGFHESSSGTLTIAVPANVRAGDVMVAVVNIRSNAAVTAPGAWTLIRNDLSTGNNMRQVLYYRVITGAEPANYSWTYTSTRAVGAIVAYRGVDLTTPLVANVGQANNSSTSITAPTVNTGVANTMLVSFFGTRDTTTINGPAGMTERAQDDSGGTGVTILVEDEFRATAGLTGTRVATAGIGAVNIGQSVVLRPRATVPAPIAEYQMDETSWNGTAGEVTDSSSGLDGTALGGAQTTTTNAYLCRSGQFTGSPTRIDVPYNAAFDIRSTLTVTAWIRPGSIPTELMSFLSKDTNYEFHIASNARVNWWWGGGTQELFSPNNTVAVNQWTFVAFVFTRGAQTMYAGGPSTAAASVQTGTENTQLTINANKLQIGDDQDFNGGTRRWNGLIDEVRIYDYALTQAEVEAIRTSTRTCPTLLAGFAVTSSATASTCVAQSVTIRAVDSLGNTIPGYTGTVNLSTSIGRGGWAASGTSGPVTENGNTNDGIASYTFRPADNGQATLLLSVQSASNLTVTATDSVTVSATGTSSSIAFRDNAFVIASTDALANVPVAARPHAMQVSLYRRDTSQSPANCAVATDYTSNRTLKAWYTADASHPAGATAPSINGGAALGTAAPGASNLTLNFTAGVATFNLTTADVGKFVINLRDDTRTYAGAVDIDGSSPTLTVRPFALAITGVQKGATVNPEGSATSGSRFIVAGDTFSATVGGYLWAAADDANNDGVPDAGVNFINNGVTPRFAWATTIASSNNVAYFSPTGGVLGALGGTASLTTANYTAGTGTATVADLRYPEVGSIGLTASVTSYLNTAGVDLVGNAVSSTTGQAVRVGRFYPNNFALLAGAAVTPFCGSGTTGFTYMDQPALTFNFAFEARNLLNAATVNYRSTVYNVGSVAYVAENNDSGVSLSARLTGIPAVSWTNGVYSVSTTSGTFNRPTVAPIPDGPYESLLFGAIITDPDGARVASPDMNASAAGCGGGCDARAISTTATRARFGRLRIGNALGSPSLALPIPVTLEYWNGTGFVRNALDSCTRLTNTNVAFGNFQGGLAACNTSGTPAGANAVTFSGGQATNFRLSAPNLRGSVDLTVNLRTTASGSTCSGGTASAATAASQAWLLGNWGATTYDQVPVGRASFGLYSNSTDIIYQREQY